MKHFCVEMQINYLEETYNQDNFILIESKLQRNTCVVKEREVEEKN